MLLSKQTQRTPNLKVAFFFLLQKKSRVLAQALPYINPSLGMGKQVHSRGGTEQEALDCCFRLRIPV